MQPCMMPQTALNYPPRFQKCCPLFAVPMHHDRHGGDSYREKSKRQREAGTVWDKSHALSHVYCYGRLFAKLHANFNIAEYRCFFFQFSKLIMFLSECVMFAASVSTLEYVVHHFMCIYVGYWFLYWDLVEWFIFSFVSTIKVCTFLYEIPN